jgi:hypothetical protein
MTTCCVVRLAGRIQVVAEIACTRPRVNELRIERVVHFPGKHLLALSRHGVDPTTVAAQA